VLTTESRQKARELFLQTHRPFSHIRVDFCKERNLAGSFVGEEEVYSLIEAGALDADNRLFLVIGEAGAGKSELCQWLEYRTDPARRLPIHIPRSMTSAAHVAVLLRTALGMAGAPLLRRTPVTTQAHHAALSAAVILYEQGDPALMPVGPWEALLDSAPMRSAISEHLTAAGHGDTGHALLSGPEPFEGVSELDRDALSKGWPALRRLVGQALEQALWLGDLRDTLRQIGDAAVRRGVRPLLLLEDVTAFRVLGDRLLDYLLDLTSGRFDAVIGATTGFERTQLAGATLSGDLTHVHHRLRARLVLTDDQGRAYGLEDDITELARGYLRAIRAAHEPRLDLSACDEVFGADLFPFTETALRRAFAALHEEGSPRQTPRLFLEHVLGATLLSPGPPPTALDRSAYILPPPALFRVESVPDAALRDLLRWYGDVGEQTVTLDRRVADAWDIPIPAELDRGGRVYVERAYVAPAAGAPAPAAPDWQQELRELQRWLNGGGLYPSRETLKRGVERLLFTLGDPRSLASPDSISVSRAELFYARGDERIPIALARGSGDQAVSAPSPKVLVRGLQSERGILEELAYLALSGAEITQVCQNIAVTLEWARAHFDTYQEDIRALFQAQLAGLPPESFILMAWQLLAGLRGEELAGPPNLQPSDAAISYGARTPWSDKQHWGCYSAGEELIAKRETFRRLYIGAFTLRDTLLDRQRLDAALGGLDLDTALEALASLPLASLRSLPFRVRPTGERLYDLVAPLQRYALALRRLDLAVSLQRDAEDLDARARHLAAQTEESLTDLRSLLDKLRWRCGDVGVVWRESWDAPLETLSTLSQEAMGELSRVVGEARVAAAQTAGVSVWSYQRLRHLIRPALVHPYWEALGVAEVIRAELLRGARAKYRGASKSLVGTAEYRALLKTVRAVQAELRDE
jgi:hypothetical protein